MTSDVVTALAAEIKLVHNVKKSNRHRKLLASNGFCCCCCSEKPVRFLVLCVLGGEGVDVDAFGAVGWQSLRT